jgi:hypothetical protein
MRQLQARRRQTIVTRMMKMPALVLCAAALTLPGCAVLDRLNGRPKAPPAAETPAEAPLATEIAVPVETTPLGSGGQSPDALDTTSTAEKEAALAAPAPAAGGELGRQVVALGSPIEQGLWVQTSLVTAVTQGSVRAPNGQTLAVELRPGTGAALMSLAAYQALGIALTDLPELVIFGS